jgi:DNA-binding transcriptional MerR regulator
MTQEQELLSTREVAEFANVTPRQLQWWDERGLICARDWGHTRQYTPEQAMAARVAGELRRKGVALAAVRKAVRIMMASPIEGRFLSVFEGYKIRVDILDRTEVVPMFLKGAGAYLVEIVSPDLERIARERRARRVVSRW